MTVLSWAHCLSPAIASCLITERGFVARSSFTMCWVLSSFPSANAV